MPASNKQREHALFRVPTLRAGFCLPLVAIIAALGSAGAQELRINEILANNQMCCPDGGGEFADWIEIYNAGPDPVDLAGLYITDDLTEPTAFQVVVDALAAAAVAVDSLAADSVATDSSATTPPADDEPVELIVEPGEFLVLWADGDFDQGPDHVGLQLRTAGEQLGLFAADGFTLLDSVSFGASRPDVSFGRQPDGGDSWLWMESPTPGRPNRAQGKLVGSDPPLFSHLGGAYDSGLSLSLFHPDPQTAITFTIDGALPTRLSGRFWGAPISLDTTTVVRARAFTPGRLGSDPVTHTFLIDEEFTLPVVSIATDPRNLWDEEIGIYVEGNNHNFLRDWERPSNVEFFETDGEPGFNSPVGLEIHGGWTRRLPQKSLAINFRAKYGPEILEYQLFPDKDVAEFSTFILRNSGNDWVYTLMRDAILQCLIKSRMELDYQAYRPTILFLNGRYWGIHNLRERIDARYITANYGIAEGDIDLLELRGDARTGETDHYDALLAFLEESDMSGPESLRQIESWIDVDNFINYQVAEIFFANTDWPGNNIEFWRPRIDEGRWRWILFDTDYGFNLELALNPSPADHNTLELATATDGPEWPNPPWSTFLLRTLLDAPDFRSRFIHTFVGHLGTTFQPQRVIAVIDSLRDNVLAAIPRHTERWRSHPAPFYGDPFPTVEAWEENLEEMRDFARLRTPHVLEHLADKFALESSARLSVAVEPEGAGTVELSGVAVDQLPWSALYFTDLPLQVEAIPRFGYEFVDWSSAAGEVLPDAPEAPLLWLPLSADLELTDRFAPTDSPAVLFNEINYNSSNSFAAGDWVELHNPGGVAVDISGWTFRDEREDHRYRLPEGTVLAAGGFAVICQDSSAMRAAFSSAGDCLGSFGFGLSGEGERIALLDSFGRLVDAVHYDDRPPWPREPDGTGPTLSLRNPGADNDRAESWAASDGNGTPGTTNRFADREPGVDIADFDATGAAGAILLSWRTRFEIDNRGFEVYRFAEHEERASRVRSFTDDDAGLLGRSHSTRSRQYAWADKAVEPGIKYSYFLAHITTSGKEVRHVDRVQSARAHGTSEVPAVNVFAYPNPFNDTAVIAFQLATEGEVSVRVYNSLGQHVDLLMRGKVGATVQHVVTWDGTDRAGRPVASGLYLCRVMAGSSSRTAKLLLLR